MDNVNLYSFNRSRLALIQEIRFVKIWKLLQKAETGPTFCALTKMRACYVQHFLRYSLHEKLLLSTRFSRSQSQVFVHSLVDPRDGRQLFL